MDLTGTKSAGKKSAVGSSRKREVKDYSLMESSSCKFEVEGDSNQKQATFGKLSRNMSSMRSDVRLPSASKHKPMPMASKSMSMTTGNRKDSASPLKCVSLTNTTRAPSLEVPVEPLPKKKRIKRRLSNTNENDTKFRPYQSEKWQERFDELVAFQRKEGHCLVPHTFPENPALARWVKRQRYQYGLFQQDKTSSMTEDRIVILEQISFIWDSHEAAWQERLKELLEFKNVYGTCAVPSKYSPNQQLARWVKCQRRQYRLYWEGKPSNMNADRIAALQNAGFEWRLRRPKVSDKTDPDEIDPIRALLPSRTDLKPPPVASCEVRSENIEDSGMIIDEHARRKAPPVAIEVKSEEGDDSVMIIENHAKKKAFSGESEVKAEDSDDSVMIIDAHAREMPLASDKVGIGKKAPPVASEVKIADRDDSIMIIDENPREETSSSNKIDMRKKNPLLANKVKAEDSDDSVMIIDEPTREKSLPVASKVRSKDTRKNLSASCKVASKVTGADYGGDWSL